MGGSVNGGGATINAAVAAEPAPAAAAAPADSAACDGGSATQFVPALPVPTQEIADAIKRLQQGVPGPVATPVRPTVGGGATTFFQAAQAAPVDAARVPFADGSSTIANLRAVSTARTQYMQQLTTALSADAQRTGTTNSIDRMKLDQEASLSGMIDGIIQRLEPLASTIDATENASILKVVDDANRLGSVDPVELARTMVQIEGSGHNLPASYMASAGKGQDLAQSLQTRITELSGQSFDVAERGGVPDPVALQQLSTVRQQRSDLEVALHGNLELAMTDPAAAQAKLDAALQLSDVAAVIRALA